MDVTEIRIFPKEGQDKKLKAYVSVTFDDVFVVRDIKVIQGTEGLFIAMPSRKAKEACPECRGRNDIGSKYCGHCGGLLTGAQKTRSGRSQADHRDIAHPITQAFRDYLQSKVLEAYHQEIQSS